MANNNVSDTSQCLISRVYTDYYKEVVLYFCSYTHDEMKAEDMTQELFLKLLNHNIMVIEQTAKSLIFTMAKRMILDDARHVAFVRKSTGHLEYSMQQDIYWTESEPLECRQMAEMEKNIVGRLPKKMREVYCLTRFEGMSNTDIAEKMNISKRTVEYHLLKSRKIVRNAMHNAI